MGEENKILFVAGLGRCGTTMMMRMLDVGGFPVAGLAPGYETDRMSLRGVDKGWVRQQTGRAVKWVDPLHATISRNDLPARPVILHMDRPSEEMARSQLKLLATTGVIPAYGRREVRAVTASIRRDKPILAARLAHTGTVYHFTFEWILAEPEMSARKLGAILQAEFGHAFDADRAASVVLYRSPLCAPDMAIELGATHG